MAFDLDVILTRIQHLEEAMRELHLLRTVSLEEFESNFRIYRSAERLLQVSTQAIFDIGEHILASELCSVPQTYRDIIRTLGRLGVLPKDFARELEPLAGLRNILVHEYLEVDRWRIYQILQQILDDF